MFRIKLLFLFSLICIFNMTVSIAEGEVKTTHKKVIGKVEVKDKEEISVLHGPVPIDLVRYIAKTKIEETWGPCAVGPILKCYYSDNTINTYYVILKLGKEPAPSLEGIMDLIRERKKQNAERMERKEIWGVGEYCTVIVSVNYEGYPLPRYFQGLPTFLVNQDIARSIIENELSEKPEGELKYYDLGHGGEYFLYQNGNNELLIHAGTLMVMDKDKILGISEKEEDLSKEDKIRIEEMKEKFKEQTKTAWQDWLKRYKGNK